MSASRSSNGRVQPLSPSFAPSKLTFADDWDVDNNQRTPPRGSPSETTVFNNKENIHSTPLSSAKDSQYKTWLHAEGYLELFRDPNVLSMVIRALREYSRQINDKVHKVLQQNELLKLWRTETGEPALQSVERYQLVESELKSAQTSLNAAYEEKKRDCVQYIAELKRLRLEMKEVYAPKVMEHAKLLKQIEVLRGENKKHKSQILDTKQIETYELQIEELHERLRLLGMKLTTERENKDSLKQLNNRSKTNLDDWEYEEQEAIQHEAGAKLSQYIIELSKRIETANKLQNNGMRSLGKLQIAEFAKLNQTLHDIKDVNDRQIVSLKQSLNSSLVTLSNTSHIFDDETATNLNEKVDKLTMYLRNLKIDQRIITVYRKLDAKMQESEAIIQNLQKVQVAIQFGQESQEKSIDNSLSIFREVFENELISLAKLMNEIKEGQEKQCRAVSLPPDESPQVPEECQKLFNEKILSPIRKEAAADKPLFNDSFMSAIHDKDDITERVHDLNKVIEVNCYRLNEMIIKEFVHVLVESLSQASQHTFNRSFIVIRNIIDQLVCIQWDYMKSVVFKKKINNNRNNNSNKTIPSAMLRQYKTEINDLFKNIYQHTINNVVKELISDKMERVKIQTKISKLTLALNDNEDDINANRMILQVAKISFKQIYYTLMLVMLAVFVLGLFIGFWFRSSPNIAPSHHNNYSFMSPNK